MPFLVTIAALAVGTAAGNFIYCGFVHLKEWLAERKYTDGLLEMRLFGGPGDGESHTIDVPFYGQTLNIIHVGEWNDEVHAYQSDGMDVDGSLMMVHVDIDELDIWEEDDN